MASTPTEKLAAESAADLTARKTFLRMSVREKLAYAQEIITVEPLIAVYVIASTLCAPMLINLKFEKACRVNLGLNDTVCDAILNSEHDNYTEENVQVQILVSNLQAWQLPVSSAVPLILVLFLGSFSDRRKWRKPFLLLPIFGEFFSVAACILCVVFMRSWPLEALGVAQTVIPSLFGGQTMIVMAVFAYIADVSTIEMRTLRVGIVQLVLSVCLPATQAFSGNLFYLIGYYGILLVAAALYAFGFLYGIFLIKEPKQPIKESKVSLLYDLINPRHVIDTCLLLLKKSPGNKRIYILLLLVTMFVYSGVNVAEGEIFFLYVQKRFHWTILELSYFSTINTLVHLVGVVVAVPVFTKWWRISDTAILLLTFADKIAANVIFGVGDKDRWLYVAVVTSVLTGVTPIAIRSLATKIVSQNDLGKAQSLFGIFEGAASAALPPIYNAAVYNNTLSTFPAAFFFVAIALYSLCCVSITCLYIYTRTEEENKTTEKSNGKAAPAEKNLQTTHL